MKNIGVILSGCGVFDGSEIHEATLTLLFLDRAGVQIHIFAPDKPQKDVVDHFEKKPMDEKRNVLTEAARIVRGDIEPLSQINIETLDAIIFPGGFGAAKNLCNYAVSGPDCEIDHDVEILIKSAHEKGKPIGCICIAPVLVARALKGTGAKPKLTIGTDEETIKHLEELEAVAVPTLVNEVVVDENNKIVSTPAYMLARRISEVASGIEKLVERILGMC